MKVAYLCADFGIPVYGSKGAAIHVRELSQALQDLGHEVRIFAARAGGEAPAGFSVPVVELPLDPAEKAMVELLRDDPEGGEAAASAVRSMLYAASLRHQAGAVISAFAPEMIYERYALFATAGGALARALGLPLVLEVNAPLSEEQAAHRGLAFGRTARAVEGTILRAADRVVAVSDGLVDWLTGLGVEEGRITVLPNGVDVARFAAAAGEGGAVRELLGLDGDRPVIGFVGTLKPWHGTPTLLRAFARLRDQGPAAPRPHLLIVGEGPERPALEALARQEGIAGDVTFTGAVPHEQVPAYLAAMDVATAPYDRTEDFYFSPLKLFEYMAAGRPVVAAATGQIRDCVRHGETGLLYPPGDIEALAGAVATLVADPTRAGALGQAGQIYVAERHTWEGNARAVVDLVRPSLQPAGGRR